jgi:hypothetical protein
MELLISKLNTSVHYVLQSFCAALPINLLILLLNEVYVDGFSMKCDKDNGIEYERMEVRRNR